MIAMKTYQQMTKKERAAELERQMELYRQEQAQGYKLDMTRGKPDMRFKSHCIV